jgi:branched-chain amino acid transport system ATP-binding protein
MRAVKKWFEEWRPSTVTMGGPVFPLLVLFGLNAVDELDRSAFGVLLPEIRKHFHLSFTEATSIIAFMSVAVLLIEVPLSFYVDRGNRIRIAWVGAAIWAAFSFGTGLAWSVPILIAMRIGAGGGKAVVTPTHSSLLSDYYSPQSRVKVFSFHRQANSVGIIIGPAVGGILGYYFGWRLPFFVFAFPTLIFVFLCLRLTEPERGLQDRLAGGGSIDDHHVPPPKIAVRDTVKEVYKIRTIRRIWCAVPFLSIALVGVGSLLSLVYDEVFGVNAAGRGLIAAGIEPLQIVGVFLAIPWVSRKALEEPGFLLRFVAITGVFNGLVLAALAYAPNVWTAILCNALLSGTIGTLAPAFYAMISIVTPSHIRAVTFSSITVVGIPGIAIFLPLVGALADSIGIQPAMLLLIPMLLACGFILASARKFVAADMAAAFAAPAPASEEPGAAAPVVGD